PPGLTYVSDDGGGAYDPATGQWTVGALANTASATLHIVVTVNTTDEVKSTAQITAGTPLDPNPDNNQASITLMSPRQADLEMSMSVSSPTVFVGGSVTYTLTVKNNGDDPAYSVSVNESFPAYPSLNPTSFTASQGVYDPSTGVWNLASLGKGNSATLTLTLNAPNTAGALTLEATATSSTSDPNTANNTASATTTVLSPATVTGTKTRSGGRMVSDTVTYTVTLSNSGSYDQQDNPGHEFEDVLPAGLTLVSASASSGTATPTVATNTVTWDGVIPAGGSVTITITATIDGPEDQTVTNQGTINYDADGNGVNEATAFTDDPSVDGASNPTTFIVCTLNPIVTTDADSGPGSLRYWIENVCDGGTITFDLGSIGSNTITIADQLLIEKNLTIEGPGADQLTIQRDSADTANFRIFTVDACTAWISGLTISNGKVTGGAGGGILNEGTLTLTDSVISHNSANLGGGIRNLGTLNIKGSTLSSNSATGFGGLGGAISNAVAATAMVISNSTISNNSAVNTGGAIHTASATVIINTTIANNSAGSGGGIRNLALLGISNSTISTNSAVEGGGILSSLGAVGLTNVTITNNRATDTSANAGGGIKRTGGLFRLDNTIVAGNFKGAAPGTTASDIEGGNVGANSSYNLIGAGGAGGLTDGVNNNHVGVALSDLKIGPLASNGGATQTHALLAGSPALDAGDDTKLPKDFLDQDSDTDINEPVPFDQRGVGFTRRADAADADTIQTVDIGAFEADPSVEDIADKSTAEDTPLTFTFNVGDAATDFFSITATSLNQTLVPDANLTIGLDTPSTRTLSITPVADESGTATIAVTVTKNIGGTTISMTDTFVLTVTEVNDAPLANPDTLTSVLEDSGQRTIPIASLLSNDSVGANETGQLLTLSLVPGSAVGGTASSDAVNVYFTPTANYNGAASFQYTVTDDGTTNGLADPQTSAPATVSFNITPVNDAPYLDAINNVLITEDAPSQTVLMNNIQAGDAETDGLSITATSDNPGLIPNPTVNYTSPNAIGTLSFTPVPNQNGSALITVTLTDDGGTANGGVNTIVRTFTVTVTAVNDAPVNTVPGAQTTMRNSALTFNGGNLIAIADVDAGASAVQVTLSATNGTLSLSSTAGLAFTTGDGTSDATMTFAGTIANINAALNNLSFTPTANFNGAASLQITTNDQGNTGTGGALSDTDTVNITVLASTLQFSSANFTVDEATGHALITVTRLNGTSSPASVDYATGDLSGLTNCDVVTGNASPRCDFTAVAGTLNFIAGQTSATFDVPIINDVYVEGPETLPLILSNPQGDILGTQSTATLTITDNDNSPGAPNPIDDPAFFVRLLYMDILNREPEAQGFADWLAILQNCPQGDTTCDLVEVSSGFFRSPEFFDRAYYIYRFYEVGLGRKPDYDEFQRDFKLVAGFLTSAELEARKQKFAFDFSQRADFKARYDQYDSQTHSQEYVDALAQTAGVTLSNRQQLNYELANSIKQRWDVLRAIVEGPEVSSKFFNKAFVVIGYFAFLRRDPDAQYLVWLAQLDNPPAGKTQREIYREMIAGFIFSQEYRHRFGP
ncbi:MAG TPA: cadherin-like domain-containing protein, partial [Pyrinomonadaceae bacterium]|nr:cadherin-like domain-containing protein [Pyrinomonadaceae bacterium]